MLRVYRASGEEVLAIQFTEFLHMTSGMSRQPVRAQDLKRHLQDLCGLPRFRQRLLRPEGQILPDDAVLNGPVDVQLVLLPFSPSSQEQIQELHSAAVKRDPSALEQLLQRPQDPNLEVGGRAPLLNAAECGSVCGVRLLLEAKADKDRTDAAGKAPLYLASYHGWADVVCLLLEAKVDKDKADTGRRTPMFAACVSGQLEIVRLLLEARADKDKVDAQGRSPMYAASSMGHRDVVLLLESKADHENVRRQMTSASHGAEVVQLLLGTYG